MAHADRVRIGLVLSGGGARGIAHIATLKLLDSLQIPVDYIAGTSMGGLVGALYSIGYSGKAIDSIVMNAHWDELLTDLPQRKDLPYFEKRLDGRYQLNFDLKGFTPVLPMGLIQGQKLILLFSRLTFPYEMLPGFDRLPTPFRCVAVDLISGKEVVLGKGSLPKAMRATMSIPSVFSPVEWGDSLLIDGGLVNNLPVDVVKKMGADIVIAVNVGTQLKSRKHLKSIIDIFEQSFNIPQSYKEEQNLKQVDILISPKLRGFSPGDFNRALFDKIKRAGYEAARKVLPELISLKERIQPMSKAKKRKKPPESTESTIHSIEIRGNRILPFTFIYKLLGIVPGRKLDLKTFNRQVMMLYGLNYFRNIYYDIIPLEKNRVKLILYVEERPLHKLSLGFRYDDYRHVVVALGLQGTNIVIPGLRAELDLQFPEITWLRYKLSYPSRSLNQSLYPYIRAEHKNIPHDVYDLTGDLVATYVEKSFVAGAGIGLLLSHAFNLEGELDYEINHSRPELSPLDTTFNVYLKEVQLRLDYDGLDDILLPQNGLQFSARYEASLNQLGSPLFYQRLDVRLKSFLSFSRRHTIQLSASYASSSPKMPIYKKFTLGGPESFIGSRYEQFSARQAATAGGFYRFRYKKDIFFKLYFNMMFDYNFLLSYQHAKNTFIVGYGLGLKFTSIIGPVELILAQGQKSFNTGTALQNMFYFKAGYIF